MKLFVIDLMNLAMRAYHGFGRSADGLLATSSGKFTYVCYGVALAFNKLISDYSPDAIIVCTDTKGHTFRHAMYPLYKSNRGPAEENFVAQLPDLFKMVELYGFKLLRKEATEADDIIGTIVKRFAGAPTKKLERDPGEAEGCYKEVDDTIEVTIVSGDKDYMQLVGPNCNILKPENMGTYRWIREPEVYEKFGCAPSQVVDALAMIGDSVDVVPGVAGIGPVAAKELLAAFGSLEAIYANVQTLKPKYKDKLLKSMDNAFMSKRLVTINRDIDIEVNLADNLVRANTLQDPELRKWFAEMEFRSFLFEGAEIVGESGSTHFIDRSEETL